MWPWRALMSSSAAATARDAGLRARSTASRRYSRSAVSTWSLRERPRCTRLPASPIRSVSRFSSAVWPSSCSSCTLPLAARVRGGRSRSGLARWLRNRRAEIRPCAWSISRVRDRCAHVVRDETIVERMILAGRVAQHALVERRPLSHSRLMISCAVPPAQHADVLDDQRARAFVREHFGSRLSGDLYEITCTRRTPPRIASSIALAFGSMPSLRLPCVLQALRAPRDRCTR